jgi:hypothetical protein
MKKVKIKKQKKFKDPFLKPVIMKSLDKLNEVLWLKQPGAKEVYYLGNFQEDVLNNFSQKQAENIFKKMKEYQNINCLTFFQRKIKAVKNAELLEMNVNVEPTHFYEYIVCKQ